MLQTIKKVLIRFVILFVNFVLGGIAGISLFAFFRTLLATLGFIVPIVLFALIFYKDRHVGNFLSFLAGGIAAFYLILYAMSYIATEFG